MLVSANKGGAEDPDVGTTVSRALHSSLLAPILLVLGDCSAGRRARTCSHQWQDFFSAFLSRNLLVRGHSCVSSHIVSSENPCCVSDRPRKHRRVCCHFKKTRLVFENCQICSSESHALWRLLSQLLHCSDSSACCRISQSCPSGRQSFATL